MFSTRVNARCGCTRRRFVVFAIVSSACAPPPQAPPPQPALYASPPQPALYGSPPPPAAAPCLAEGGYDCTPDRRALTVCRGGRTLIASTCRGSRGCTVGNAVDCDHSIAIAGDPCEDPKEIACAQDKKALLRCTNGSYQVGEACRNACLSTSGRILCQ